MEVESDNERDKLVAKMRGQDLNLRFCRPEEVNEKRKHILIFKMRFLARVQFMQLLALNQDKMRRLDNWIEENIDWLYKNYQESSILRKSISLKRDQVENKSDQISLN